MPPTDIEGRSVTIGDDLNNLELLVINDEHGYLTIDLFPAGRADTRDEGGAVRLDEGLASKLAAELFRILTH